MANRVRASAATASVAAVLGIAAGFALTSPQAQENAPGSSTAAPPAGELSPIGAGVPATLLKSLVPQWEPGPAGTIMTDEWGEHPQLLEAPAALYVIEGPLPVAGVPWFHVYVLPNSIWGPNDYFAWLPGVIDGEHTLRAEPVETCPAADIEQIALLAPPSRARCFGQALITLEGHTWFAGNYVAYQVEPAWIGTPEASMPWVSLYDASGGLARPPDERVAFLDLRIPPEVPPPPWDFHLQVTGRFNHPAAASCERVWDRALRAGAPPRSGLPDEATEDSQLWCRSQFVVTEWEVLAGPEGRPLRAGTVQLHRTTFDGGACAGVGMPPLTFHVDPSEVDPIWLETKSGGARIVPIFGAGFSPAFVPELVVIGPDGRVAARDGLTFNPDEGLGGYAVCSEGATVTITAR